MQSMVLDGDPGSFVQADALALRMIQNRCQQTQEAIAHKKMLVYNGMWQNPQARLHRARPRFQPVFIGLFSCRHEIPQQAGPCARAANDATAFEDGSNSCRNAARLRKDLHEPVLVSARYPDALRLRQQRQCLRRWHIYRSLDMERPLFPKLRCGEGRTCEDVLLRLRQDDDPRLRSTGRFEECPNGIGWGLPASDEQYAARVLRCHRLLTPPADRRMHSLRRDENEHQTQKDNEWVQREGGPREEIQPGDVVWFAPEEKHWHGATATTGMTHIAIQENLNGKVVEWMEHVSDEQYQAGKQL
ncbi:MAG: transcriptional regulator [Chthonomonadales bacterium]|nr:transcriptional regulator [Chthonomonadales bacterium]